MSNEVTTFVDDTDNNNDKRETKFRIYQKRWIVMADLSLINFTITTIWLSFGAVSYKSAIYYDTDVTTINWLSMGTMLTTIFAGLLWSWLMNKMGLKSCMLISSWLMLIGAGIRVCSTIGSFSIGFRLFILFAGHLLVAFIQPLAIYSAPILAAVWFPSDQRSLANCVSGTANAAGVIMTGLVSPIFVTEHGNIEMRKMLITYCALPLFCAILTTIVMTTDGPPTPPSYGGTVTTSKGYLKDVKKVLTNKNYVILMIGVGSGLALYALFATLIDQLLCPWGYTEKIAGLSASLLTGSGIVGALLISVIVDRTKLFSESLKLMLFSAAIATTVFVTTHKNNMGYLICLEMIAMGLLSFGIAPIGMETAAEITFPVGVSISAGLVQVFGQIFAILMILVLQSLGRPMEVEELTRSTCRYFDHALNGTNQESQIITYDMTVSGYVTAGTVGFVAFLFLIAFRPTYKRMNAERRLKLRTCKSNDNDDQEA